MNKSFTIRKKIRTIPNILRKNKSVVNKMNVNSKDMIDTVKNRSVSQYDCTSFVTKKSEISARQIVEKIEEKNVRRRKQKLCHRDKSLDDDYTLYSCEYKMFQDTQSDRKNSQGSMESLKTKVRDHQVPAMSELSSGCSLKFWFNDYDKSLDVQNFIEVQSEKDKTQEISTVELLKKVDGEQWEFVEIKSQEFIEIVPQEFSEIVSREIVKIESQELLQIESQEIIKIEPQEFIEIDLQEIVKIEPQSLVEIDSHKIIEIERQEYVAIDSQEIVEIKPQEFVKIESREIVEIQPQEFLEMESQEIIGIKSHEFVKTELQELGKMELQKFVELESREYVKIQPQQVIELSSDIGILKPVGMNFLNVNEVNRVKKKEQIAIVTSTKEENQDVHTYDVDVKRYECSICNKRYTHRNSVYRHCKKAHYFNDSPLQKPKILVKSVLSLNNRDVVPDTRHPLVEIINNPLNLEKTLKTTMKQQSAPASSSLEGENRNPQANDE